MVGPRTDTSRQLRDEYDQIWRDVEVFSGFDVDMLDRSYWRFKCRHGEGDGGVYVMQRESWDSPMSVQHTTNAKKTIGGDLLANLLQLSGIGEYIPPFKITINPDDRPIVRNDWHLWEKGDMAAMRRGFLSSCSPSTLHDFPPLLFPARSHRYVKPSLRLPGP
ncbi:hypothetical protein AAF712_010691 [Marasmius tenuissimus]|uniref:Uncharacterized protein n=1 Tax=Marasmius tenuissimus TaxID=585030 RepID=A0ABR2ZPU8_9AGAR